MLIPCKLFVDEKGRGENYVLKISRWDFKSARSAVRTTPMNPSVLLMSCIAEEGVWGIPGFPRGWVDALEGKTRPPDHQKIELS